MEHGLPDPEDILRPESGIVPPRSPIRNMVIPVAAVAKRQKQFNISKSVCMQLKQAHKIVSVNFIFMFNYVTYFLDACIYSF